MPAERYFSSLELVQGGTVELIDQEFHHLKNVMRTQEGETIELVNGRGQLATAELTKLGKKSADLHIQEMVQADPPAYNLILAQAIPRPHRLEFILEKGTELGMTEIWLFPSQRSERKNFTPNQIERFEAITIAAMKQCGRLFLPKINLLPPLTEWHEVPPKIYFGDVNPNAPPLATVFKKSQGHCVCIGPESGFTDQEVATLVKMNAQGVKLHGNILRTDTAAIVALALLAHLQDTP